MSYLFACKNTSFIPFYQVIRFFCGKSSGFFVANHSVFLWQIKADALQKRGRLSLFLRYT
ncbi:MAG: hypothetical protein ACI3YC_03990, partial [Alloprevotella sp.]